MLRRRHEHAVVVAALALLAAGEVAAQMSGQSMHVPAPRSILFEDLSHILVGVVAAIGGVFAHRAWSRRRWRPAPAATVIEAVLAVDLVDSTQLATRHGDALALRARNVLERRVLAAAEPRGATFVENTGDGCMMTFSSVLPAAEAAAKLLQGLHDRPPDLSPGPPLEIRGAITYGEILIDARGKRHGAAINKAFRVMSVSKEAFVDVEGETRMSEIPDRNRVLLDEDAANELESAKGPLQQVGVCRLKGFSGFHRVYGLHMDEA